MKRRSTRTAQRSIEAELWRVSEAVLTPVRWVVLLGILASLPLRFGLEINRPGVLTAAVLYGAVVAGLPHLRGRPFTTYAIERLLLAADLAFSAVVFYNSGGIRSPYFGLWHLALIHAALMLGPRAGMAVAAGAAALVTAAELNLPGGRAALHNVGLALGTLPFLLLITWAAGRLGQEVREREAARRQAEQRALALEAEEVRVRHEMEIARRVQDSLLPVAMTVPPGLTLAAFSCPAREVGGDTYDVIELPDGRLLVAIADVSGKGVPAALLAVAVQHGMRQFAGPDPAAVLAGVNRLLCENCPDDMFVTAACVVIDPRDGSIAAASAGHPPPLWWNHPEGRLMPVPPHTGGAPGAEPGPILGLLPEWSGRTGRWRLAPGDAVMLYTDGVLDAKVGGRDRWGEERLAELLGHAPPEGAGEWVARLRRDLEQCAEWPDDVTAVAIRWEPLPALRPAAARKQRVAPDQSRW